MRIPKPWYRAEKDCWYARVNGKRVSLGVRGKGNRKQAVEAWHKAMLEPKPATKQQTPREPLSVAEAVKQFVADARERTKPSTHELYARHLAVLVNGVGSDAVASLTAFDLNRWLRSMTVASTTKAIMLRSVSAFLGWCVKQGMMARNPALSMVKPRAKSRSSEAVIGEDEHGKLMELATPQLRLVLSILHATGCRPGEVCRFAVENFNAEAGCVVLAEHKADRHGHARIIFLPPDAFALLKAQAERFTNGPLLRNGKGRAWTPKAIAWAIIKLRKRAGVKAIAYGYRHSFATTALANGVPDATVAALLGHSSTAVLHRHYAHLTSRADVLREAVKQVRA